MSKAMLAADTGVLNAQKFYDELDRLFGASIGVIAVRTREMSRGKLLMHQWASMRGLDFHVWDCLSGFQVYRPLPIVDEEDGTSEVAVEADNMDQYLKPTGVVDGTSDIIAGFEHYRRRATGNAPDNTKNKFCGVFMGVIEDWLKHEVVQQHIRDHVQRAYQCDDRVVMFLTPGTSIPDAIVGDVEVVDLYTPSFAELSDAFNEMVGQIPDEFNYAPDEDDSAMIVQNAMGMTQQEFENAVSLAIVDISADIEASDEEVEVDAFDFVKVVRNRKLEILKQTQILELMPDAKMDDVGGLDRLKADLELQRAAFTPEARAFGIRAPKGFLVVGPPGTGKTLVAQAAAHALGVPGIKFEFASVFNSLVGSSEQRMKSALRMLEEMAPCVAFIDEIDKAVGNGGVGGGDSGVTQRIFGMLLTWMQEKSDRDIPVLVVASANNVSHIPPELLRKGRFDDIWAVSFPSPVDRAAIFKIHTEKRGHTLPAAAYEKLAKATDTFVGAEIETVVAGALLLDFQRGHETIQIDTIQEKIDQLTPQAKIFPEKIAAMARWCKDNAREASSDATFAVPEQADGVAPGKSKPKVARGPGLKLAKRSSTN